MNALTMDSVLFVPAAELAEPVSVPVLRSMKAQPKKLALPGPLIAAGWAGARSVGAGGAGCVATWATAAEGDGWMSVKAATARLCAPNEASAARLPGRAITATPTRAATQATRTTRGRMGDATPKIDGTDVLADATWSGPWPA